MAAFTESAITAFTSTQQLEATMKFSYSMDQDGLQVALSWGLLRRLSVLLRVASVKLSRDVYFGFWDGHV